MEDLDFDEKRTVADLLDHVAGDSYEGWETYWETKKIYEKHMIEWLKTWKAISRIRSIKGER